jgi:hypothetical protein
VRTSNHPPCARAASSVRILQPTAEEVRAPPVASRRAVRPNPSRPAGRRPVGGCGSTSDTLIGMEGDYPVELLAREAEPAYDGETPFALWHFSYDPTLDVFRPRASANGPSEPLVWTVGTRHAPMFWFPRDCPRGCIWAGPGTSAEDRERFFGQGAAKRVHVIETAWLESMRTCQLFAHRLSTEPFRPYEVGGYWVRARRWKRSSGWRSAICWLGTPRLGSSCASRRRSGRSGGESPGRRWSSAAPASATPHPIPTSSPDQAQ